MIEILTALTVAYAVVLVLAIAASVITVGLGLSRVADSLGRIAAGLTVVERQTAPLGGYVDALNGGLGEVAMGLTSVAANLTAADDELAIALGEPTSGRPTTNVA